MISLAESIIQPDIGVGAFVKFNSQTGTGGGVPRRKKSARAANCVGITKYNKSK